MYPQTTKKFRGEDTGTFISEGNTYDRCSNLSCFVVLFVLFQLFLVRAFVSLRKTIRIEFVLISLVVDSCCIHLSFWCLHFTHSTPVHFHWFLAASCIRFPLISSFLSIDFWICRIGLSTSIQLHCPCTHLYCCAHVHTLNLFFSNRIDHNI